MFNDPVDDGLPGQEDQPTQAVPGQENQETWVVSGQEDQLTQAAPGQFVYPEPDQLQVTGRFVFDAMPRVSRFAPRREPKDAVAWFKGLDRVAQVCLAFSVAIMVVIVGIWGTVLANANQTGQGGTQALMIVPTVTPTPTPLPMPTPTPTPTPVPTPTPTPVPIIYYYPTPTPKPKPTPTPTPKPVPTP